ncbi:MAG: choice-of-anchor Q domain-containing protein, partial [Casimicrobium sp.]
PGSGQLTIDGSLAAGRRILGVTDFVDTAAFQFNLSGVRLLRGSSSNSFGGCVAIGEHASFNDVIFESCESVGAPGNFSLGGALAVGVDAANASNVRPNVSIANSVFLNNRATRGTASTRSEAGALALGGNGNMIGTISVVGTTFNGNAADTRGAALIVDATSVTISSSNFIGNAATGATGRHGGLLITFVSGNVTINNGTRINGNVAGDQRAGIGINTVGGTVTLDNVDISGNYANRGSIGGADIITDAFDNVGACTGTSLQPVNLTNVRIQGNSAAGTVGGLRVTCSGAVTMTDVSLIANESRGYRLSPTDTVASGLAAASLGFDSFPTSTLTMTRVNIEKNADLGTVIGGPGSIVRVYGMNSFMADGLIFRDNYAQRQFGFWLGARAAGRNYLITNSEFSGNNTDDAPALYIDQEGSYTIRNTTVAHNRARNTFGSAITAYNQSTTPGGFNLAVEHSTIARNSPGSASTPSAFRVVAANAAAAAAVQIAIKNSILGQQVYVPGGSPVVYWDPTVTAITAQNNLVESSNGLPSATSFCAGTGMKCDVPSLVAPIANNGGASGTHTMALMAGSPAIDSGGVVLGGLTTDQRGAGFPRVNGAAVDMGALESSAVTLAGCTLDLDGNGTISAATDGLMMARALFGLTGTAVTGNALGASPTRGDWASIRSYVNANCGTNFAP